MGRKAVRRAGRIVRGTCEALEARRLLANLAVSDAYLTDTAGGRLLAPPVVGEEYGIRVEFAAADVPDGARFRILYEVGGVGVTSNALAPSPTATWNGRGGFFARGGVTAVRVKVDSADSVSESDEGDNEIAFSFTPADPAPPFKLAAPVEGAFGKDWVVTAYADLDPRPGTAADHQGRDYTFDGSKEAFFTVGDGARINAGVSVLAAAPGTVLEVRDGQPDYPADPPPANALDNYVLIDHGNGWRTRYGRLRDGSVGVAPGQAMAAGQALGLVGASGTYPGGYLNHNGFLRLEVLRDAAHIETFLAPDAYWQSPPAFAGDSPGVDYITVTDRRPDNTTAGDFEVDQHVYGRQVVHRGENVFVVTAWHNLNKDLLRQTVVYRPDGTRFVLAPANGTETDRAAGWRATLFTPGLNDPLGEWAASFELAGEELGRTTFLLADPSQGLPEIKIYQGTTYVLDGRVTPLDFGVINQGAAAARRTFTVRNDGTAPLALEVTVPEGFGVVGTLPTSVPAQSSRALTLQLDSAAAGAKAGWVTIHSNDAEQGEFTFRVKGAVNAVPAAVAGRHVFYNGSAFDSGEGASDEAAIAPDKQALLSVGQSPSFANVTSYTKGINALLIDVLHLPAGVEPGASDFQFELRDASNGPATAPAPAPSSVTVRRGAGVDGSDRIRLTWPDGAIKNAWLGVRVLATPATGLPAPDAFAFGNLVGDAGDFRVNALDLAAVKRGLNTGSDVAGRLDFNRDRRVNALDMAAARSNLNRVLQGIVAVPAARAAPALAGPRAFPAVQRVWDEAEPDAWSWGPVD